MDDGNRGVKTARTQAAAPCLEELVAAGPSAVAPSVPDGFFLCKGRASKSNSSVAELKLGLGEGRQFQDVLDGVPIMHFNQMESLRVERSKAFHRWRFLLRCASRARGPALLLSPDMPGLTERAATLCTLPSPGRDSMSYCTGLAPSASCWKILRRRHSQMAVASW